MSQEKDVWQAVADPELGKAPLALQITDARSGQRTVRLEIDVTYIGRMPENHIVLDDPKVSRSHARITGQGSVFTIEDLQSENGVHANGKRTTKHTLTVGDRLVIGDHMLEVVPASEAARTALRESQLDRAEEEEWRLDRTISVSPEELIKMRSAAKPKAKSAPAPTFSFTLKIGEETFTKEFAFEKGKHRPASEGQPNTCDLRIEVGPWILAKKVEF